MDGDYPFEEKDSVQIKVLTYNMFLRPLGITTNGNDFKNDRLETFLEQDLSEYDIICLQEVFGSFSNRRDKLITGMYRLGFAYHYNSNHNIMSCPFFLIDGGLITFSRHPIIENEQIIFDKGKHADAVAAKGVLYTKIQVYEQSCINVYNLHLQSISKHQNIRENQLQQLRELFYETVDSNAPSIICGDFNIDYKNEMHYNTLKKTLTFDFYNTKNTLESTHNDEELKYKCTYGDFAKEVCLTSKADYYKNELIDYIWIISTNNRNIEVLESDIEPFYISNCIYTQLSDHYAVYSLLEVPTKSTFVYF